jgi:hypothetical protein
MITQLDDRRPFNLTRGGGQEGLRGDVNVIYVNPSHTTMIDRALAQHTRRALHIVANDHRALRKRTS